MSGTLIFQVIALAIQLLCLIVATFFIIKAGRHIKEAERQMRIAQEFRQERLRLMKERNDSERL